METLNRAPTLVCTLTRLQEFPFSTIGILTIDGEAFFTLELPNKNNAPNISCIPKGEYLCKWGSSPKYGDRYEVMFVPNRTAILIHAGNNHNHTHGCILLGTKYGMVGDVHSVLNSRSAMRRFHALTKGADLLLRIR